MTLVSSNSSGDGDFQLPPPGVYTFRLLEVGEPVTEPNRFFVEGRDPESKRNRTTIKLVWKIEDQDPEVDGTELWQFYTATLGTTNYPSKLRGFVEAMIYPDHVVEGVSYDLDEFIGQRIQATLVHKKSQDGTKTRAELQAPVPLRRSRTLVATGPQEAAEPPF